MEALLKFLADHQLVAGMIGALLLSALAHALPPPKEDQAVYGTIYRMIQYVMANINAAKKTIPAEKQ